MPRDTAPKEIPSEQGKEPPGDKVPVVPPTKLDPYRAIGPGMWQQTPRPGTSPADRQRTEELLGTPDITGL